MCAAGRGHRRSRRPSDNSLGGRFPVRIASGMGAALILNVDHNEAAEDSWLHLHVASQADPRGPSTPASSRLSRALATALEGGSRHRRSTPRTARAPTPCPARPSERRDDRGSRELLCPFCALFVPSTGIGTSTMASIPRLTCTFARGGERNRTAVQGFAGPCLTSRSRWSATTNVPHGRRQVSGW